MSCRCRICGFESDLPSDYRIWPSSGQSPEIYPVTTNGKPNGRIEGWICARCLGNAMKMRLHTKSMMSGIRVSKHALERFLERQDGEPISEEVATAAIIKQFRHAKPIEFRQKHMIQRLLNHGQPADYFYHAGTIFVTTQESPRTILTIERQWHRKFGRDFWLVNSERSEAHRPTT